VLRIVLPIVTAPGAISRPIADVVNVLSIRIIHEIVIIIYIYIVISAPSAITAPTSAAPGRSNSHANSERNRHARGVVAGGRVGNRRVRIRGSTVNNYRVVAGNVDHIGLGLLDHDHAFVLDDLCFYFHLLVGFQVALLLGLRAHALHSVHHVGLLG
jgi:hypothetical protein